MAVTEFTFLETFWWNFYVVDRNKTTFRHVDDVPDFVPKMVPMFIALVLLENVVLLLQGKKIIRINDGITSASLGLMREVVKKLTLGFELIAYTWLYQYRLVDWQWDSAWTWWGAALAVDFGYYWFHRCSHEINFLWSSHQVHHSSEEYNLTTAFRQPFFHRILSLGFYHPLALLGVPTSALIVHIYFNLFYQFWIHTELIPYLGPLEMVFNTASHHRVHHGMNKWCLDKNYGGTLIIWDRIFGTFQAERTDEKIVYGLVVQPQTFEPIHLQLFYFKDVLYKLSSIKGIRNKLKCIFYGPGWHPGTSRLGDPSDLPDETKVRPKHQPTISSLLSCYVFIHFFVILYLQQQFVLQYATLSWSSAIFFISLVFASLFVIGSFLDGHLWVVKLEAFRCAVLGLVIQQWIIFPYPFISTFIIVYLVLSSILWTYQSIQTEKAVASTKIVE